MIDEMVAENTLFLEEGKNVLIEEFGKDYGNYFSILSLIASGKTSRVEIESIMEIQTGGFLDRLEKDYGLIKKIRPVLSKPNSRSVKYAIEDNFLSFWFRFIYKHRSAVEAGNLGYIKDIILRDYNTYSGKILEKYFVAQIKLQKKYNIIGTYWERGNQNEIDIVAVNEVEKKLLMVEVKRNGNNIQIEKLKEKSGRLIQKFRNYSFEYRGYSLSDM
jgi:AAA+ ATPase superfamily predicted ATPase